LDLEEFIKDNAIQVHKIYDDETFVILAPLTLKASQVYGAGTKWCTSSREYEHQFYKYTQSGILLYIINKKDNQKYAYHKNTVDKSGDYPGAYRSEFFNAADCRIDSLDAGLPLYVWEKIRDFVSNPPYLKNSEFPNYDWDGYWKYSAQCEKRSVAIEEEPMAPQPTLYVGEEAMPAEGRIAEIMENPQPYDFERALAEQAARINIEGELRQGRANRIRARDMIREAVQQNVGVNAGNG
jgi:hypothetical protein